MSFGKFKIEIPALAGIFLASVVGCLPPNSEPKRLGLALASDVSIVEGLIGARVKELFVVIFPKDYSVPEWQRIFEETNVLSRNKQKLRAIEGLDTPEIQEERAVLIGKNAEILSELGAKSLFMMNWSIQDENCRISKSLKILCRPFNPENPMNGGLPTNRGPLQFIIPDPVQSEIKTPYLSVTLEQLDESKGPYFGLNLRLKPESSGDGFSWYKGDVTISGGSRFRSQADGSEVASFFPYGYSELTLQTSN
ncbi:MAG: hypothetical protein KGP28_12545 [Bdellovibrionales bacterium]|nr:hypothetical protein [Bdellovibrionales bacterium]